MVISIKIILIRLIRFQNTVFCWICFLSTYLRLYTCNILCHCSSERLFREFVSAAFNMSKRIHWQGIPEVLFSNKTSNQRLGSAGDNDRRSKRFCSNAVLCVRFAWQIVKTLVIRLRGVEGQDAGDQIAFCAFYSFLLEVQTNAD